ncbi:MFS transporter [Kitasatospora phosalacinea]|uniref:MFS transporter n=1 Tax=Kitasatospora phosalacinea TaxID=2065 RepID=A0A9W6V646_9ACTN|nr:MFS transporter [Kitasatospora phosalacinea]GLW73862.1 MFS transporter [Kitasatospora phosalacinea]
MSSTGTLSPDDRQEDTAPDRRPWPVRRGLLPEPGPRRGLALGGFVNQLGTVAFLATAPLYALKVVGLTIGQVGLALGIAGVVGLLAGPPVGHLADRRGPRGVFLVTLLVQTVSVLSLLFAHSFVAFTVSMAVTDLAGASGGAARGPMIRRFGGDEVPRFRSYLRATAFLASTFGALAAGAVIQLDSGAAYRALVVADALTFVGCAAVVLRLPALEPLPAPTGTDRWLALRDGPYVAFVVLDGVLWIQGEVITYALPLWVVLHTHAPRWFVGVALAVNTVMVVLLQVRTSRGTEGGRAAGRATRRAGLAFLVGMAVIATAPALPGPAAAAAVAVGVAVHTAGSLWHAAGSLELRFRLAPAHAQGQYSGVFGIGTGLCYTVAPGLLGLLCLGWGAPGWLVMGGVFVAAGLAVPLVVRWAGRSRELGG